MWAYIGVTLISFLVSGLFSKYIVATAEQRAEAAASYDLLLMLASSSTYQIWAVQHQKFALLVVGDFAAAAGTYLFIRWSKANRNSKKSKQKESWGVRSLKRILGK